MTFQCCFCGGAIPDVEVFLIEIYPPSPGDWCQSVYSHKQCLVDSLHVSVTLHPDLEPS